MILLMDFAQYLSDFTFLSRATIVFIIAGFMPLMAISFFYLMMDKKQKKYDKAMTEMGLSTTRKIRDTYSPGKYILPVGFATLICLLAAANMIFTEKFAANITDSLLLTGAQYGRENVALVNQSLGVVSWAFIGGFIWSAQNIVRRLINYDLAPNVFFSAGVRIILATAVALVLSFLVGQESAASGIFNFSGSLPALGFLSGMFPERILNYLVKTYEKYISSTDTQLNTKILSLYNIQGMSLSHKERLAEASIDNAQNLATASLTQLLIETPYEARQLLDWIGQAKLLCYAQNDIDKLRSVGIRSVFDLQKGEKSPAMLQRISDSIGMNQPLLHVLREQVMDDEGIRALYAFQQRINAPSPNIPIGTTAVG